MFTMTLNTIYYTFINNEGKLSWTNIGFALFYIISLFLALTGSEFRYYEIFGAFAVGGGLINKTGHTYINSKYNSPAGEPPRKSSEIEGGK